MLLDTHTATEMLLPNLDGQMFADEKSARPEYLDIHEGKLLSNVLDCLRTETYHARTLSEARESCQISIESSA
jgi:hypothetical protein